MSLIQIQVSYPGTVNGKVLSAVSRKLHIIDSLKFIRSYRSGKVLKNEPRKVGGRQPLKNLKGLQYF